MKRIHITESIRKIARQRRRRRRKSSGLHGLVSQVAFGLLLAFYNREKPIQSFDVPLLQLQPAGGACAIDRTLRVCWLFRLFSRHISGTLSFQENRLFYFHAFVALKLLVSLIGRLVACTARISVDRQTDRQTDKQTDRPSTVILAAHARRGLIVTQVICV